MADEITCNNRIHPCAGELHLQGKFSEKEIEHYSKDSQTPRPAPKVTLLRAVGNRSSSSSLSLVMFLQASGNLLRLKLEKDMSKATGRMIRLAQRNLCGILCHLMTNSHHSKSTDLRVEGVSKDAILQDEEQMKEINKKLEKLRIGSCTKSIRDDLKKEGDMIFHLGDYSVSFFPETHTRGIEHVSMKRLASTQSRYDGPNHSVLSCSSNFCHEGKSMDITNDI